MRLHTLGMDEYDAVVFYDQDACSLITRFAVLVVSVIRQMGYPPATWSM